MHCKHNNEDASSQITGMKEILAEGQVKLLL